MPFDAANKDKSTSPDQCGRHASQAFLIDLKFTQKKTQKIDCDCGTVCVREKVYGREREEPEKR